MPTFDTIDEVKLFVKMVTIPEITEVVSELGKETLNKAVDDTVYKEPSVDWGKSYDNTFGLRGNAGSQVSTYGKAGVASRVHLFVEPKGKYPSFYLNKGSLDNSKFIVGWLNERDEGGYYKGNEVQPPNHKFIEKTALNLIKGNFLKKTVQEKLKTLGYVISRTLTGGGD